MPGTACARIGEQNECHFVNYGVILPNPMWVRAVLRSMTSIARNDARPHTCRPAWEYREAFGLRFIFASTRNFIWHADVTAKTRDLEAW